MPTDPDNARLADERLVEMAAKAQAESMSQRLRGNPSEWKAYLNEGLRADTRAALNAALRQQVRAVPGGLDKDKLAECPINGSFSNGSLADYYGTIVAALSTQPDDEFIHRAPTSVDPSLEGPGMVPDAVRAMIERLRETAKERARMERFTPGAYPRPPREHIEWHAATMLEALHAEIGRLREALVESAIPLEAILLAGNNGTHSPELWSGVENAVKHVRATLAEEGE